MNPAEIEAVLMRSMTLEHAKVPPSGYKSTDQKKGIDMHKLVFYSDLLVGLLQHWRSGIFDQATLTSAIVGTLQLSTKTRRAFF